MAFDPNKPVEGSPLDAGEMRNQLNGLNDNTNAKPSMDDVNNAITTYAARNCDGIQQLNIAFHDPVSRAEAEAIQAKLNEVINGMHS